MYFRWTTNKTVTNKLSEKPQTDDKHLWSPLFTKNNEFISAFDKHKSAGRLDFILALNLTAHSRSNLSLRVGGEIQSLSWDPTGERLAVLLKGLSPFSSIHPTNPISVTLVLFLVLITRFCIWSFITGDPQAADRPAIIAVFKTRSNPIFELLPWFVLKCCVSL